MPPYAPTEYAETVDHGGVRVGANERVGIGNQLAVNLSGENYAGKIFQIYLVADSHPGRNGGEVAEGRLAPLQECITLAVALEFKAVMFASKAPVVPNSSTWTAVVNDEFCRDERIDALRVTAQRLDGVAHPAAARSTTAGTPVRSCMRTRAGM